MRKQKHGQNVTNTGVRKQKHGQNETDTGVRKQGSKWEMQSELTETVSRLWLVGVMHTLANKVSARERELAPKYYYKRQQNTTWIQKLQNALRIFISFMFTQVIHYSKNMLDYKFWHCLDIIFSQRNEIVFKWEWE